jgi:hypothetical protein
MTTTPSGEEENDPEFEVAEHRRECLRDDGGEEKIYLDGENGNKCGRDLL